MTMHCTHSSGRSLWRPLPILLAAVCAAAALLLGGSTGARASTPAAGWVEHNLPSGIWLTDCAVTDATHAWAVRSDGAILDSANGGATWKALGSAGSYLYAVAFGAPGQGWAVGGGGIFAIKNGSTLVQQTNPTPRDSLLDVTALDAQHAWIVGGAGCILVTANGGKLWSQQSSPTGEPLEGVAFADLKHGWAVGWSGTILATSDGGTTWTPQSSPTTEDINRIACSGTQHAWAVGNQGAILATTNGGATWKIQPHPGNGSLTDVACTDSAHVWAVGLGIILASANGGATWFTQYSGTGSASYVMGVAFANATHGLAVDQAGSVRTTATGGWLVTSRPITKALRPVTVKQGHKATLRYKVIDPSPPNVATVTITVKTKAGKAVKTWKLGLRPANVALSCKYKISLKKGAYRWYVYATDAAGNKQSKVGWSKLKVT